MITKTVCSSIIGHLLARVGLVTENETHKETRPTRVKRDNEDLKKLMVGIRETMNPFDADVADQQLYCISTGRMMPKDIRDDVLNTLQNGKKWYDEFKEGCFAEPARFEKPILRRKTKRFASAAVTSKLQVKDKKVIELMGMRDLFRRLLFLASERKVDLKNVFSYPVTPVPLSLAQVDGSRNKTDKSKLMHALEDRITSGVPPEGFVYIQDAMFMIQGLIDVPDTFGGIAKFILSYLCKTADEVHFICDTYPEESIKGSGRDKRASQGTTVSGLRVTGPDQRRPKDFHQLLRSGIFKASFLLFIAGEWQKDKYACILGNRKIVMGLENVCYRFMVGEDRKVVRSEVPELASRHEEADTRIVLHLSYISKHGTQPDVVIRCDDTDVLVILLYHLGTGGVTAKVWMDSGVDSKNNRRYIDVTSLAKHLGNDLCSALPAVHAFTGCDFTCAFLRKGKVRPLQLMERTQKFIKAFAAVGEPSSTVPNTDLEAFVCALYGKPSLKSVSDTRYAIFRAKYAPTNQNQHIAKLKGADASVLPPSSPILEQKIKMTHYVPLLWKGADQHSPPTTDLDPCQHGWERKHDSLTFRWFDGDQLPMDICQAIDTDTLGDLSENNASEDEIELSSSDESDSESECESE